ncbi:MAG: DUF4838 domain-containing protein, partial [Planctomycetota bacterium]|nr:DUF4838 domain-containing protein [Planctomycetota bacterium]
YPILGGRRRVPGRGTGAGWQPCLTHPKAVDFTIDYAREYFERNPQSASISLGINDGGRYCECERCLKLVDENLEENAQRSLWFFRYANKVGEAFDQHFPTKQIGYLLYGRCKMFPENMKIHPRLIGFYVTPSYRLITEEGKQLYDEGLAQLTKSVSRFALYDWFYGDGLAIPRMQIRQAAYYLKKGYDMGARHLKAEAYMNWGLDGFKYWIHAKLLWDPSADVDTLMNDFFTRFFKESAQPMKEYFKIVERYSETPVEGPNPDDGVINYRFRYPVQLESFPPKAVEECLPHLDKAAKLARSYIVSQRVKYFRQAFEVSRMLTMQYHFAKSAIPLLARPESLSDGMSLLAKAMHPSLNVDQYYQWVLKDDDYCVRYPDLRMFGTVTMARGYAARTLSNAVVSGLKEFGQKTIRQEQLQNAVDVVLDQSFGKIDDPEARDIALTSVAPFARKVILCPKVSAPVVDGKIDE